MLQLASLLQTALILHQLPTMMENVDEIQINFHCQECLTLYICCCDNIVWGKNGVIWFIYPNHSLLRKAKVGSQDRRLEAGTKAEAIEGCCSLACFPQLSHPDFLIAEPQAQRWCCLQLAGPCHINNESGK